MPSLSRCMMLASASKMLARRMPSGGISPGSIPTVRSFVLDPFGSPATNLATVLALRLNGSMMP